MPVLAWPGLMPGAAGVLSVDGKEVARNSMEHSIPITLPEDETFACNLLLTIYLGYLGIAGASAGPLLWPAAILHLILALLLVAKSRADRRA